MPYEVRDLDLPEVLAQLKELTNGRVVTSTIVVNDDVFVGYLGNERVLREALGIAAEAVSSPGSEMLEVLDPMGETQSGEIQPAPRPSSPAGITIGVIDNGKWNVEPFLQETGSLLRERYGIREVVYRVKPHFSRPAPEEICAELMQRVQAVIAAVGD